MHGQERPRTRQATRDDADAVAALIGDAFRDDPVLTWLMPHPQRRHDAVACYFRAMVKHVYLPHGQIDMADDASGAALCLPAGPSTVGLPVLADLGLACTFLRAGGLRGLLRAQALQAALRANRPSEPHVYLHALGVHAAHRGRGVGSALLQQITAQCDRRYALAYLENTNARNLPLYERHGFTVLRAWTPPGGGPRIWFMARG